MELQTYEDTCQLVTENVERFVQLRTGGTIRGLKVDVVDSVVVISGRTNTYYNKQLATHAALNAVAKSHTLENAIEVC